MYVPIYMLLVERMTECKEGMFLFAKLVLDNLCRCDTYGAVQTELEESNFPTGIESA